jgi:hypothetical protein
VVNKGAFALLFDLIDSAGLIGRLARPGFTGEIGSRLDHIPHSDTSLAAFAATKDRRSGLQCHHSVTDLCIRKNYRDSPLLAQLRLGVAARLD